MKEILDKLYEYSDAKYKLFISKLTPTYKLENIIGVRVPKLREIVKEFSKDKIDDFFDELPHEYYEENLIHGFLIQRIKNYEEAKSRIISFLPYIDNWATSDTIMPLVF